MKAHIPVNRKTRDELEAIGRGQSNENGKTLPLGACTLFAGLLADRTSPAHHAPD